MPLAEVAEFVRSYGLPPDGAAALHALVARLVSESPAQTFNADLTMEPSVTVDPTRSAPLEVRPAALGGLPGRYEDAGFIGVGGMGEVRRVRDRELGRTCAFKVIRADLAGKPAVVARFVEEAQVAAQLQHPNIAPVYDAGRLADGRTWFTMQEVRGRTLTDLIAEVHGGSWTDASLRRLADTFAKVCEGVGYAHARGVVHRDLKPDNVMIGAHGEVLVLDWGLAKVVGRPDRAIEEGDLEPEVASTRSADEAQKTRVGGVLGTAAYMSPEQARGEVDGLDARADVYALGAILYEILAGRPPYEGRDVQAVLGQVLAGPPESLEESLPEDLVALCLRCMARAPGERPADGSAVGAEARAWLDGAKKREKALEVVADADGVVAEMAALRERAEALRQQGNALLVPVKPWAPEDQKAAGWAKQDEAEGSERELVLLELRREALLQGALTHAPELVEAHKALAEIELERHEAAEAARDDRATARAEVRLREHADALPEDHEVRRRVARYLRGDGALSLVTDPPGAEVELFRYELKNRRLVAVPVRSLGRTPLVEVPLPRGSYLCVLRHPERADVRYPVSIGRGERWEGVAPGEPLLRPVRLPLVGELGLDECLVPAGPYWNGGDAEAVDSLPRRKLWCDELVVKRFPVTNREYLLFLDDLVATGREAEALHYQPRERAAGEGSPVYGRDDAGRFVLRPDADGDVWDLDWPVFLVDWFGATAYAAWLGARTGKPWRLAGELEWEKAARGVDGRYYPWGDGFDPSWCCMRASHPGRPMPEVVSSYPVDESVYGVRGLGGNIQEWCADGFRREGPIGPDETEVLPPRRETDALTGRVLRGGDWNGAARLARSAYRSRGEPGLRLVIVGFRLLYRPGSAPD